MYVDQYNLLEKKFSSSIYLILNKHLQYKYVFTLNY